VKKIVLFILSTALLLGLFACSDESEQASNNDKKIIKKEDV